MISAWSALIELAPRNNIKKLKGTVTLLGTLTFKSSPSAKFMSRGCRMWASHMTLILQEYFSNSPSELCNL